MSKQATKKRANGEGTIPRRADGRLQAAVYKPDGKRKFIYPKTREAAHNRLANAQKAVLDGLPIPDERTSVGEFPTF